ncbi:hypothetical protein [Demequina rhizosphaerae]|uniref:hypothetical protein n=1 Tax=Demequina rhizosphaerae TaxID=1638985 RepID=UPI000785E51D|nr:hypothetical protein [Demequina rhizosphaerae]
MSPLSRVEVLVEPGLYELRSVTSTSRYYVDTRLGTSPRHLRVSGVDSFSGRLDSRWQPLRRLVSHPVRWDGERYLHDSEVDGADNQEWVLRAGSQHVFLAPDDTPGKPPFYWVQSSACKELRKVEELPTEVVEWLATVEGAPLA